MHILRQNIMINNMELKKSLIATPATAGQKIKVRNWVGFVDSTFNCVLTPNNVQLHSVQQVLATCWFCSSLKYLLFFSPGFNNNKNPWCLNLFETIPSQMNSFKEHSQILLLIFCICVSPKQPCSFCCLDLWKNNILLFFCLSITTWCSAMR